MSSEAGSGVGESNGSGAAGTTTGGTGSGTSRSARRRRNRSKATGAGVASVEGSRNGSGESAREKAPQRGNEAKETEDMAEGMTLEEQGEVGRAFVADLLGEFGMEGTVETRLLDEDTVEIAAMGEDLGTLVGPRGSTLAALQDLTRAVVQRQCPSRTDRILVDVAGYRERRSAAEALQHADRRGGPGLGPGEGARADEPCRPQGRARRHQRSGRGRDSL